MRSMTSNSEITARARAALSGHWGLAVGVYIVWICIYFCVGATEGVFSAFVLPPDTQLSLLTALIAGPMTIGIVQFFIRLMEGDAQFEQLFDGFRMFWKAFAAYFMYSLFLFLWMLLLLIPGLIKSFSYSMTFFVLADEPEKGPVEAITRSRELMDGNKWKYFCLQWRFFGWGLLSLFTCGIGFLWLCPYMQASLAAFYRDIKEQG